MEVNNRLEGKILKLKRELFYNLVIENIANRLHSMYKFDNYDHYSIYAYTVKVGDSKFKIRIDLDKYSTDEIDIRVEYKNKKIRKDNFFNYKIDDTCGDEENVDIMCVKIMSDIIFFLDKNCPLLKSIRRKEKIEKVLEDE